VRLDVDVELELADCHFFADPRRSTHIAESAAQRALQEGNDRGECLARLATATSLLAYEPNVDELGFRIDAALEMLDGDDHTGLTRAWLSANWKANFLGRNEERAQACERAIHHSRAAGHKHNHVFGLGGALINGPRPADIALRALEDVMPANPDPPVLLVRAQLLAMLGHFEDADKLATAVTRRLAELGGRDHAMRVVAGDLSALAVYKGDHEAALEHIAWVVSDFERLGQPSFYSTASGWLALRLCRVGRYDEAEVPARRSRELGDERDIVSQRLWREALALVHSHRGEYEHAERLAREAVSIVDGSDDLAGQAETRADLACVLEAAGRRGEALDALEQALDRFERKKNLPMVSQLRPKLEALREEMPT
jgi:tetratricopeptide (TPR) repeat protein